MNMIIYIVFYPMFYKWMTSKNVQIQNRVEQPPITGVKRLKFMQ